MVTPSNDAVIELLNVGEPIANPYVKFVADCARLVEDAKKYPLGGFPPAPQQDIAPDAPRALFFAPHPDDETIVGAMALRILREAKMNLINVAVTQGSKKERQVERLAELKNACDYLGYGLQTTVPNGLEKVTARTRQNEPQLWTGMVKVIADILAKHSPRVILFPHERDWNGTHIGVHYLVMDALRQMPANFECYTVETEFWGAMDDPNLMVEVSAEDLADLIAATTFHVGEVKRNPYHLLLPAWMMDNVRRGAELVGGQGGAAPDFTFAALYRLRKWSQGCVTNVLTGGKFLSEIGKSSFAFHVNRSFMREAIRISIARMRDDQGGPFGAVVVRQAKIVGRGWNRVTSTNDPTAHAEIVAIRDACRRLKSFQLDDCELYTSCEPCPMCLAAVYWARLKRVYYANTREDAARIAFDDEFIYREVALPISSRRIPMKQLLRNEALAAFTEWKNKADRIPY